MNITDVCGTVGVILIALAFVVWALHRAIVSFKGYDREVHRNLMYRHIHAALDADNAGNPQKAQKHYAMATRHADTVRRLSK